MYSTYRRFVSWTDPSHVLDYEPIKLRKDLTYVEWPIRSLDRKEQVLKTKTIPLVISTILLKKIFRSEKKKSETLSAPFDE